jgi:hypothetical protein
MYGLTSKYEKKRFVIHPNDVYLGKVLDLIVVRC